MLFNTIILVTLLLALIFEAKEDSCWYLYQIKKLPTLIKAHIYQNLLIFTILAGTLTANIYKNDLNYYDIFVILAGYLSIRFGIFDWLVNIFSNRFWLYLGSNSYYDLILKKYFGKNGMLLLIFIKGLSTIFGLYLLQRYV